MRDPREETELAVMAGGANYRISIVIPTRVGWPGMRRSVDAVLPQLDGVGGQLIVADASGLPAPEFASADNIEWLRLPGTPSYLLRKAAYARASAPIIAVTEDHCAPTADWASAVVAAHHREPGAAVVYGLVENGSREHAVDWALYSVGYIAWAPPAPLQSGTPGHANLSFKAWVFQVMPPEGERLLEFRYVAALRDAGYRVVATDGTRVTHFQSAGLLATATLLFHNGRAIAGLRRERMTGRDWVRTIVPGWICGFRTLRTLRIAASKPEIEPDVRRSAPLIALLHLAHAIGESVGYLGGPGESGRRLH